jgi:quercetin dioxygenase-like cupin family protein
MKQKWVWILLVAIVGAAAFVGNVLATPSSGLGTTILAKGTFGKLDLNARSTPAPPALPGSPAESPADLWQAQIKTQGLSDVYVVDNKLAVGGTTGWHSHPGPSLVFVIAGAVTNYTSEDPTCAPEVYAAGSTFVDAGGTDVHMLRNEGTVPAETIAVQFLPKDAVRRIDEPAPANCPS